MKTSFKILLFLVFCLTACESIETGQTLEPQTIHFIKSLGLLDENETIIKYYSNFSKDKAGNFFTDKRIAHYWLDKHDVAKNDTSFALYSDIVSIDTIYTVPDTYAAYMNIKTKESGEFKVYVDGKKHEIEAFFKDAIHLWRRNLK